MPTTGSVHAARGELRPRSCRRPSIRCRRPSLPIDRDAAVAERRRALPAVMLEVEHLVDGGGVHAAREVRLAVDPDAMPAARISDTDAERGIRRAAGRASGVNPPENWLVGQDVVGLQRPVEDVGHRGLHRRAKMPTNATRPSPIISAEAVDAVRRGFRTAFSRPRRPGSRQRGERRADGPRPAAGRCSGASIATPTKISATPSPTPRIGVAAFPNRPNSSAADPDHGDDHSDDRSGGGATRRRRRSRASPRSAGSRGAPGAAGAPTTTSSTMPTSSAHDDRPRQEHQPGVGSEMPNAFSSALQPERDQQAEARPNDGRDDPRDHRLDQHRAADLRPARAERPQQRQLAGSLRDDDRERVEDDERPDEQGDPGEHQQRVVKNPSPFLMSSVCSPAALAPVCAWTPSAARLDAVAQRGRATPGRRPRRSRRTSPLASNDLLRGRRVERRDRRAQQVVRRAERRRCPTIVSLHRRPLEQHLDGVADLEVALLGGPDVDGDLVRRRRRPARPERQRVLRGRGSSWSPSVGAPPG